MADTKTAGKGHELTKVEDWTPYVLGELRMPIEDPEDVQRQIQDEILSATNIKDILAAGEAMSADDLVGVPLLFQSAELRRSTFEKGPGCYCFIRTESIDTGERFTVTCGGLKVITKLWAAYRADAYPFSGMFTSKDIEGGKTVKSIVALPEHRAAIPADAEVVE